MADTMPGEYLIAEFLIIILSAKFIKNTAINVKIIVIRITVVIANDNILVKILFLVGFWL